LVFYLYFHFKNFLFSFSENNFSINNSSKWISRRFSLIDLSFNQEDFIIDNKHYSEKKFHSLEKITQKTNIIDKEDNMKKFENEIKIKLKIENIQYIIENVIEINLLKSDDKEIIKCNIENLQEKNNSLNNQNANLKEENSDLSKLNEILEREINLLKSLILINNLDTANSTEKDDEQRLFYNNNYFIEMCNDNNLQELVKDEGSFKKHKTLHTLMIKIKVIYYTILYYLLYIIFYFIYYIKYNLEYKGTIGSF
jgi:hypothetical protein